MQVVKKGYLSILKGLVTSSLSSRCLLRKEKENFQNWKISAPKEKEGKREGKLKKIKMRIFWVAGGNHGKSEGGKRNR